MKKILFGLLFLFVIRIVDVNAVSAKSYVVMDLDSGIVLMSKSKDDQMLIASISKIMTCIIAIENGNLNQNVVADKSILKGVGSSIYIEVGETLTLRDLLYGMMLRSGNDAAIMIANTISKDMESFSDLMNAYAEKIGMKNSFFYNSHGLEEINGNGNKSTAYDMAILTSYAMKNKTFRKIFSAKSYETKSDKKSYAWQNKNKLLKYDFISGGKTGYTQRAKRTLVTTAKINNINLVVVTLNDSDDWNDHLNLYNIIEKEYKNVKVLSKKDFEVIDDTIYSKYDLYIKKDVNITLHKNEVDDIKIKYYLLKNPKDNIAGSANVYLLDTLISVEPIYVNKKGSYSFFKKWIKKLFG